MHRLSAVAIALILVTLSPARSRTQDPVRRWVVIRVDTSAMHEFHEKLVMRVDTANVERAGPKRQVVMQSIDTTFDKHGVGTDRVRQFSAQLNCATYQVRPDGVPWMDISLDPGNQWRRVAKMVCPAEDSK
jgi:hypothetical protein